MPKPLRTPPKFRKGGQVLYQVSSCRGMTEPREGKVLGVKETKRGYWVEIKDWETRRLVKARAGFVKPAED